VRLVALLGLFFFLVVGAESAMGGWVFVYANQQFGSELSGAQAVSFAAIAAYLTSAYWGALTLGRLLGVPISTRFKSRTILFVDLLGCLVSALFILIFPTSWVVLWICTIGSGLFMASIFPTTLNLAERRMDLRGAIMRWFFVGSSLGGMVLPWIIGQLIEPIGTITVIVGMTISLLLAIAVFYLILRFSTVSSEVGNTF
jgi:fucose permease